MVEPMYPKVDYCLDEADPATLILRRQDGAFVATFSARGATMESIARAIKEDYPALVRAKTKFDGLQEGDNCEQIA